MMMNKTVMIMRDGEDDDEEQWSVECVVMIQGRCCAASVASPNPPPYNSPNTLRFFYVDLFFTW